PGAEIQGHGETRWLIATGNLPRPECRGPSRRPCPWRAAISLPRIAIKPAQLAVLSWTIDAGANRAFWRVRPHCII
ncbi:MAG: hypothetical protein ACREB6_03255, partial [Rhodospirillales bacterium]